jgi:catechol 2,3-dioxygenase-like lactoylglutathione lyase family enzyme
MNVSIMLGTSKLVAFVGTRNGEHAKAFYRDKLGLRLVSEDGFALVFDAGGTVLRVTMVEVVSAAKYTVLGWQVKDIKLAVQALGGKGVRFERFEFLKQDESGVWEAPGGARVAWFKDPDGNVLSVSQMVE